MSVIPLTTKGPSPSLLTDENKFSFEGRTILGKNLDAAQLNPTGDDCNISYDLRVGSIYRDHRDTGGIELEEGGTIQIRPGTAYIIQTEESIKVPKGVFGQITPKAMLLQKGLSNTHSKIDPGYEGICSSPYSIWAENPSCSNGVIGSAPCSSYQ